VAAATKAARLPPTTRSSHEREHAPISHPANGPEEWTAGLSVLHLQGAVRAPVSLELRRRVEALLARGRRCIVLDLADGTYLDAAGLGELVRLYTLASAARGALWIRNATRRVHVLVDHAGLFELLSVPSRLAHERCS
jgi:anti-anti-sigma factor